MSDEPTVHKATIGGDDVKIEVPSADLNLKDRDPEKINQHLKSTRNDWAYLNVKFEDIFAEPEDTTYSFDKVWQLSFKVFTLVKLWWYRILTLVCGLPCACCWGCHFACLSFCNIWLCVPWLKSWAIEMYCVKQVFDSLVLAFFIPCYGAMGRIFSFIHVTVRKEN